MWIVLSETPSQQICFEAGPLQLIVVRWWSYFQRVHNILSRKTEIYSHLNLYSRKLFLMMSKAIFFTIRKRHFTFPLQRKVPAQLAAYRYITITGNYFQYNSELQGEIFLKLRRMNSLNHLSLFLIVSAKKSCFRER